MKRIFKKKLLKRNKFNKGGGRASPTHTLGRTAMRDQIFRTPLFAASHRCRLPYYEQALTVSSGVSTMGNYFFFANGCYDPNTTGTGHQPMNFDTMMTYYEQYTVVSSKITATIKNDNASFPCKAGIYLSPDTTSITDPIRIVENGLMKQVDLINKNNLGDLRQVSLNCDMIKYFGRSRDPRALLDDVNLQGTAATNPPEGVYYVICVWNPYVTDAITILFDVILEFDVIFHEPRKQIISVDEVRASRLRGKPTCVCSKDDIKTGWLGGLMK